MMSAVDVLAATRRTVGPGPDCSATIAGTPRLVPSGVKNFGIVGILVGLAALVMGLSTERERTLGVLLVCIVYFMGVAQGGLMFAVIQTITLGRWGRPFKRIAESFWFFMPVNYLLYVVFLALGGLDLFPWTHEQMPAHKAVWLQPGFFVARNLGMLGLLMVLDFVFIRNSMRADMGVATDTLGSRAPAFWGNFTAGWRGRDVEIEDTYQKNIRLAPAIVVLYAIFFSLFAVDNVMSLAPHWFANMFPAWQFVSNVWVALNWTVIVAVFAGEWLRIGHLTTPRHFHDLGKMVFALCVFWTYNFFAHLLPIWYGNMPEETWYLILRMYLEPWSGLAKVVISMCFFIPFTVLLSRGIKKTPKSLVAICMVIACGVFLERFLLVMPQVWTKPTLPIGLVEVGVAMGFVAAFITVVFNVLARVPAVPVSDPFMHEHPDDVHVHVGHHAAH
jgi:preprotein translocase subunit Sec61beta